MADQSVARIHTPELAYGPCGYGVMRDRCETSPGLFCVDGKREAMDRYEQFSIQSGDSTGNKCPVWKRWQERESERTAFPGWA